MSFLCKYCKKVWLHFDRAKKSANGILLPITDNDKIHDCPMDPYDASKYRRKHRPTFEEV